MKLSQASMSIRKAAWIAGIKNGNAEYVPFFDAKKIGTPDEIKAIVDGIKITTGQMAYADHLTWKEIKQ